jgi:hypothetical protein
MEKNIIVIDSRKKFLDLIYPENNSYSKEALLLVYGDGDNLDDAEMQLKDYLSNVETRHYSFKITIISPKLIQQ